MHWFRKGIRLHDNPALVEACQQDCFYGVYCLDPAFANPNIVGAKRYQFLLESLGDLDQSLRAAGSRLFILRGSPQDVLLNFVLRHKINLLTFESDTEPYAIKRDQAITKMMSEHKVKVSVQATHMLRDPSDYVRVSEKAGVAIPRTYGGFCKLFESMGPLRAELPVPTNIPGYLSHGGEVDEDLENMYLLPSLAEMGMIEEAGDAGTDDNITGTKFLGGETEALRRLEMTVTDKSREQWVRSFEKPKTSPNSLEPSTTVNITALFKNLYRSCLSRVFLSLALSLPLSPSRIRCCRRT